MLKARKGFTLIELLIVIVIIGILAAIAIPKFGKTREKAYYRAMMSDLRSLQAQQELYFSNPANAYTYASEACVHPATCANLDVTPSAGVSLTTTGTQTGWNALATHQALPGESCAVYVGDGPLLAPAEAPGVVRCTDEVTAPAP